VSALLPRVIPCLLLHGQGLVKTVKFKTHTYLGDPINIVRIFNDKEVDELLLFDILATREKRGPDFNLIADIVSEAFVPVAYGGGIFCMEQARQLLSSGIEKVVLNSMAFERPELIRELASEAGSQSVVVCMDVRRTIFGRYFCTVRNGQHRVAADVADWARRFQAFGAGELIVNSVDRDGTMTGYDIELIRMVTSEVTIPVVACGGAGSLADLRQAVEAGGAAAVAAGSLFVFQGHNRAVLINFPDRRALVTLFAKTRI
jgi:imidazole glycerol-phosphate synthase subunit HisF